MSDFVFDVVVQFSSRRVMRHLVDYCDLNVVDLNKVSTPEGKAEMATLARDAMRGMGFFYIINHGLSRAEVVHV